MHAQFFRHCVFVCYQWRRADPVSFLGGVGALIWAEK